MKETGDLKDKYFYFLIVILGLYLLIRLLDELKLIYIFPLDKHFDLPAYMGLLYITAKYAFYNFVPLWYNGFILFQGYFPAWFYFTLPLYYLTNNVQVATYLSFILIYIIGFLVIYFTQKELSLTKKFAFFLLFFANPIFIGYLLRIGRITEMFSWLIFMALFFYLYHNYDRKIGIKFVIGFVVLFSILLMSHYTALLLASSLIASFLLAQDNFKERTLFIFALLISLALTSFWWVNYYTFVNQTPAGGFYYSAWLVSSDPQWFFNQLTSFIMPLILILLFYFYWIEKNKSKKELLFFFPQLFLSLLVFTRLIIYIPLLNRVPPNSYNTLFILVILSLFFKMNFDKVSLLTKKVIITSLFLLPIIMIIFSILHTPFYPAHTQDQEDILYMIQHADSKLIISIPKDCSEDFSCTYTEFPYYTYAAINYNLSSSLGGTPAIMSNYVANINSNLLRAIINGDCNKTESLIRELGVIDIVGYDKNCINLGVCGFEKKTEKGLACLYETKH